MATQEDVRRLALAMPEVTEGPDPFQFRVAGTAFAWRWLQRLDPGKARVPSDAVIAVRVASEFDKEPLIQMNPSVFFTERHYDGYPAILVRLDEIDEDLLTVVLRDGWRSRAPKRLLAQRADPR